MSGTFIQRMMLRLLRHPSDQLLVSLHDGEIPEENRGRLLQHLDGCARCRLRAAQIEHEWEYLSGLNSAGKRDSSGKDLLPGIRASIAAWNGRQTSGTSLSGEGDPSGQAEAERRVEDVLGIYLGKRAAAAALHEKDASQTTGTASLGAAGSTLRILLGEKGASAIETKIHRILSRTAESTGRS